MLTFFVFSHKINFINDKNLLSYNSFLLYIIYPTSVQTTKMINDGNFSTAGDKGHNNKNINPIDTIKDRKHKTLSNLFIE